MQTQFKDEFHQFYYRSNDIMGVCAHKYTTTCLSVTLCRVRLQRINIWCLKAVHPFFVQLNQIVLHHSMVKPLQIVSCCCDWCCYLCWMSQCPRALSRRAEEAQAAGDEENQHLHWYFHSLLCTLCNHQVSGNLHAGKGCWDHSWLREVGHSEPQQDCSVLCKSDEFPLP